ncbi:MAG: beta-ketoacyl-[acyl-carrier-protein] synthase family protein [Thermodesulfovibrionales bacterium]|nr:beta-ketoacyl-[acyl-carrier-protein] synthase family protein [Thermodesulfovibrionales bacterium]
MPHRVFVSGLGVITAIGNNKETFWKSATKGISGIKRITTFDPSHLRTQIAGEINDFDPLLLIDKRELKEMDRVSQLGIFAAHEAINDASIKPHEDTALIVGTGLGGIITDDEQHKNFHTKGWRFVSPLTIPMSMYNATECYISKRFGIKGHGFTITTACASGLNAIGEGFRLIRDGYVDIALCGGTDATISEAIFTAWCAMRILSKRNDTPQTSCRPFSKDRDGMVLGEGAGFVVLESEHSLKKRDAKAYAEILGYASTHDATHLTAPDSKGQIRAMQKALEMSGIDKNDIQYINSHGTGTVLNDKVETETIKQVFGQKAYEININAIKPLIGHTLGASGAIAFVSTCLTLKDGVIPPTINYTELDPECDLNYTPNTALHKDINVAMCNAFGFGGNNAVIVVKKV